MRSRPERIALALICITLACWVPGLLAKKKEPKELTSEAQKKRAVHALNRLTFGLRSQDVQQVMAMGIDQWIDLQLHPEKIPDAALESRLAAFRTLRMNSQELAENFPDAQMIRQVMDGKRPMPSDAAKRAVFKVQIARLQEKRERKEETANMIAGAPNPNPPSAAANATIENNQGIPPENTSKGSTGDVSGEGGDSASVVSSAKEPMMTPTPVADAKLSPDEQAEARRREDKLYADLAVQSLPQLSPGERYKQILSMPVEQQIVFADSLRGGKGQEFLEGLDPKEKETLLAMNNPQGVFVDELMQAKLLRAVYSERQLLEVMTDFWFNHFNVFVGKGADRLLLSSYEQETIRPRALGKFEDLLLATAKSPAMLFYLDNWQSVGPNSMQALGVPPRPVGPYGRRRNLPRAPHPNGNRKQNVGLNENYGRELLELHTLSVNGGYSQGDVTETAKVFTGWTIDKPFEGGGFRFDPRRHEPGPKFVLGHRIKPKGEDEGKELLHRLATSPQTAHFISLKLAERFVSDNPPPGLVDRMAKTFLKKKGEIREVLLTMFHSPEFWASETYRAKVKTPLEFVASAVRATGGDIQNAMPLVRQLNNMGMPLYGAQPPTGYSMKAETWMSSSALLNRLNFSLALTSGKIRGVTVDPAHVAGVDLPPADADAALTSLESAFLANDVSRQTHDSIVAQVKGQAKSSDKKPNPQSAPAPDTSVIAGLLLGSPEFQRR
ncbi:MAG TPA: DUF1800 domain-containing protein [Candidatus Sulfotelmatobacter sp.]